MKTGLRKKLPLFENSGAARKTPHKAQLSSWSRVVPPSPTRRGVVTS